MIVFLLLAAIASGLLGLVQIADSLTNALGLIVGVLLMLISTIFTVGFAMIYEFKKLKEFMKGPVIDWWLGKAGVLHSLEKQTDKDKVASIKEMIVG